MFLGHYALALGAKRLAPSVSLGTLFLACQFADLLWPAFQSGDFPIGWQSYDELRPPPGGTGDHERDGIARASWNLGQLVGLIGFASLAPLGLVWLSAGAAWRRAARPS